MVRGRVVDVLGAPIVGATVTLRRGEAEVLAVTTTDADGGYALADHARPADGTPLDIDAVADGMAKQTDWLRTGSWWVPFTLREACRLHGRIEDAAGRPLAGVEVTARHRGDWTQACVRTGADGCFLFAALPIGPYTVMAFRAGCQLAIVAAVAPSTAPLVVRLTAAHQRTLRVRLLGATPEQLANAVCHLHSPNFELPPACRSGALDAQGVFEIHGLPNEVEASLYVAVPGWCVEPRYTFCHGHPDSGRYTFDFVLQPLLRRQLRGRLVSSGGTPLAGHEVRADANFGGDATVVTDAEGRFVVDTCASDGEVVRFVLPPGAFVLDGPGLSDYLSPIHRGQHLVRLPCAGELELRAVGAAGLRVRGRHADGSPAPHAFTVVWCSWRLPDGRSHESQLATGSTDAAGEVEFLGLHPGVGGPVFVTVTGPGGRGRSESLTLRAGEVVTVSLVAPEVGAVEGIVRDRNGHVLAGHAIGASPVDCVDAQLAEAAAFADGSGRYRLTGLAVGTWRFQPMYEHREPPWRSRPFEIRAGTTLSLDVVVGEDHADSAGNAAG